MNYYEFFNVLLNLHTHGNLGRLNIASMSDLAIYRERIFKIRFYSRIHENSDIKTQYSVLLRIMNSSNSIENSYGF